jgi:hypothetical protein
MTSKRVQEFLKKWREDKERLRKKQVKKPIPPKPNPPTDK